MEQKKRRALCDLKIGESGHVYAVNATDQRMRRHIVDMGITPGTEIRIVKAAPMGDPIEIRVRGYELTLRVEEAEKIEVEVDGK